MHLRSKERVITHFSRDYVFRYGFFLTLLLNTIIYVFIFPEFDTYAFYLLSVVFLGIGFSKKPLAVLIILCTMVVLLRSYVEFKQIPPMDSFLTLWCVYVIMTLIATRMENNYQKRREVTFDLISALTKSLDSRDTYTARHSEKVANYALKIAKEMKLSSEQCDAIYVGGLLHDIGKIGVPEYILTNTGRLSDEEFKIIQKHPVIGYETIKHISAFNKNGIMDIVLYHHEKYDGTGYPEGLKGEEIPLYARIMAIADSYDAMTSTRVYRKPLSKESAINEISKKKGIHFDPHIADLFIGILNREK
ncbi:HD-GYP domain-containing protein [Paenibacillus alginolyticus]|uniref:HD-GYP domain-containing protein n=1 Tax=Paenibacillus alginolyticus TaxID=59839 RepID=A0ABT4G669_9BACL|nr:HD-GYP domain-containing protein [Paenibacillus alginolyticus]MCY9668644.1 HD-GYP domain-containing protein [Paenibacillus alginolyticus]MCY9691660.1 HD-GYP domain-containing protein [Paenibacillus alginolyticus]